MEVREGSNTVVTFLAMNCYITEENGSLWFCSRRRVKTDQLAGWLSFTLYDLD